MSLDLRPDTTTLSPVPMRRGDVVPVEFWLSPDLGLTVADLVCQARPTPNSETVVEWEISDAGYTFDDLTTEQQDALNQDENGDPLTDSEGNVVTVDNTFTPFLVTFDATELDPRTYVFDIQDGTDPGNTVFGGSVNIEPDVSRTA